MLGDANLLASPASQAVPSVSLPSPSVLLTIYRSLPNHHPPDSAAMFVVFAIAAPFQLLFLPFDFAVWLSLNPYSLDAGRKATLSGLLD